MTPRTPLLFHTLPRALRPFRPLRPSHHTAPHPTHHLSTMTRKPWPFAPLNPTLTTSSTKPRLAGIVFDVDGTLCLPQTHMFTEMRALLAISKGTDILAHLHTLPEPTHSEKAEGIREIERAAMAGQTPQPGLDTLMAYLDKRGVKKGICSRNFDEPIQHLLRKFLQYTRFEPVLTRDFEPPKPAPAGVLECARVFGDDGRGVVMVGDSEDDVLAGKRAGAVTVLVAREGNEDVRGLEECDFVIGRLDELVALLEGDE